MGWFGKKDKVIDLTNGQGDNNSENTTQSNSGDLSVEEKKRLFALKFKEMGDKLENIASQIYKLQQRVELLEKKSGVGRDGVY